jgi:23S rRNA-intervening sequence protein
LTRAATSVAANNRAAGHARSRREFCSKIGTVREEADESRFWLDFIQAAKLATGQVVKTLRMEAQELTAIFSASTGLPSVDSTPSDSRASVRVLNGKRKSFRMMSVQMTSARLTRKL